MKFALPLLPTTLVGSYAQPDWLIEREKVGQALSAAGAGSCGAWHRNGSQAQDDATTLAIRDQELAGLDIITDGEMRRESYSNRFATALEGVDIDNPVTAARPQWTNPVPRVVGPIRRPVPVRDVEFLCGHTARPIKITVPGPFTMGEQAQGDYDKDEVALAIDYAAVSNVEIEASVQRWCRHRAGGRALRAGAA